MLGTCLGVERRFVVELRLVREARQAFRAIWRNPGSSVAIVTVLTLAITASTVVFSLVDIVMLRTLPVKDPAELVLLKWSALREPAPQLVDASAGYLTNSSFPYASFELMSSRNRVLTDMIGFAPMNSGGWFVKNEIRANGRVASVFGELVTGNYFSMLGIQPILGRLFTARTSRADQLNVVVISYTLWLSEFDGRASAIGQVIYVEAVPYTVIGIAPLKFEGTVQGLPVDIWIPISQWRAGPSLTAIPTHWWLSILGRIKPGISQTRAQAELRVLFRESIAPEWGQQSSSRELPRLDIAPGGTGLNLAEPLLSKPLTVLSAIAILLILMTCANVSTLMLARATARQGEIAIRIALGAGLMRLSRQFLFESLLLGAAGGTIGLLFAIPLSRRLIPLVAGLITPFGLRLAPANLNGTVVTFAAAAALFTALFFGVLPIFYLRRFETISGLRGSAGFHSSTSRRFAKEGLVVAQISICTVALLASGLLVQTFANLQRARLGFDAHDVLQFSLNPAEHGLKSAAVVANIYGNILARIQSLTPLVQSASISSVPFFPNVASDTTMAVIFQGHGERANPGQWSRVAVGLVGPDFFRTMKITVLKGRTVAWVDIISAQRIAVVNQALAEQFFPGGNVLGKRFGFGAANYPYEIVGMVQNVKDSDVAEQPAPIMYMPYSTVAPLLQSLDEGMYFEVRTAVPSEKMLATLQPLIDQVAPALRPEHAATIEEQISGHLAQQKMMAWLSGLLSLVVLVLGCTSLYGVESHATMQRRHEIAVRIALGAQPPQILLMILKRAILVASTGTIIGLPVAIGVARLIRNQLYGITAVDPTTIIVVISLLFCVGLLGGYLPARKAMRVDPMTVLRQE